VLGFGHKKHRRPPRVTHDAPLAPHPLPTADPDSRGPAPTDGIGTGQNDRPIARGSDAGGQNRAGTPREKLASLAERLVPHLREQIQLDSQRLIAEASELARTSRDAVEQQIGALTEKLETAFAARLDELGRVLQESLARHAGALVEKSAADFKGEAAERWSALEQHLAEACSAIAQRAIQRPIIDALVNLHDRIRNEAMFHSLRYRENAELTRNVGCRQLYEWTDDALRSYAAEVLQILQGLGVELIVGSGGIFNPHHQRVREVEPTCQPELDGHVARILRAGFIWHGSVLRSEEVTVFKMERKNHEKGT